MKIVIGSENPTKITAAKIAFTKAFPHHNLEVIGIKVSSGIPDQPRNFKETIQGATNRAHAALVAVPDADFGVGEEGGMEEMDGKWFETGWCVIVDNNGTVGIGSAIHMQVPPKLLRHIEQGKELGVATDIEFATIESGKKQGFFGLMTNGGLDRTVSYADGVTTALSRFLHPHLFEED